jgi:RimJ/RimL family protein N-acetyltransferase
METLSQAKNEELEIRWLTEEEFNLIAELFILNGSQPPHPDHSRIVGAIHGGRVVGFMVLQFIPHTEPTWIADGYQGQGLWEKMAQLLESYIGATPVYCTVPDDRTRHMVEKFGFTRIGDAYERRVYAQE